MESFLKLFSKRYFIYFGVFFVLWYLGSFIILTSNTVLNQQVFFIALNLYYPLLLVITSYLYFRKSVNNWNDRLVVAFGWIILTLILAAILAKPFYGYSWRSIINSDIIESNWIGLLAVLFGAFLAKQKKIL